MENFKAASALLAEKEELMAAIKKGHEGVKQEVAKLRSAEVDLEQQLEELTAALKENQVEINGWGTRR